MFSTPQTLFILKGIYIIIVGCVTWMIFTAQWHTLAFGCLAGWFFHWMLGSIIVHRYITHKTFKLSKYPHIIWCSLANLILVGSTISWASMHRTHHITSDTDLDPHTPTKYSAFQLFFLTVDLTSKDVEMMNSKDLIRDPTLRFLHKYYLETVVASILIMGFISTQLLMLYFICVLYTLIGIFFSVYVYHKDMPFNYNNHTNQDTSFNNLLSGLLFHGEAYHNNHHNNPRLVSNAERWFEWDANKWLISLIEQKT